MTKKNYMKTSKQGKKVKAVRIVKVEPVAPDEHIIHAQVHVAAVPEELPPLPAPGFGEELQPIEFTPEQQESGWSRWWKSLW